MSTVDDEFLRQRAAAEAAAADTALPPLEAAFRPIPARVQPMQNATPSHVSLQQAYGRMTTRRQRAAARERAVETAPVAEFRIDWEDSGTWSTPTGSWPIGEMPDRFLWETVLWMVRSDLDLFEQYTRLRGIRSPDNVPAALAAKLWLRDQVLFRAILRESIRRNLTYPPDVYGYLKQYVLDRQETLDGYAPWMDPNHEEEAESLRPFLQQPLTPPEQEYGKNFRNLEI